MQRELDRRDGGAVGRNVRYLAGMHDVHQAQVAAYVGISVQALGNILSGRSQPRTATARRLAEAFGIGLDDLFAEAGDCVRAGAAAFERAPIRGEVPAAAAG
jgi:transcriptional regulator with XRE-family HTH domain